MTNARRCVVTLGISREYVKPYPPVIRHFAPALRRLKAGLETHGFRGNVLVWDRKFPEGCPPYPQTFAFKPFCMEEARSAGYDSVLWVDSSIVVKVPIDPLFEMIERDGYLFFEEDHSVGEFCKDEALATLDLGREESFRLRSCWACVVGLSMRDPVAVAFLEQWLALALDGITFPGPKWSGMHGAPRTASRDLRVKGHRHDQTAASVLAWRLGMRAWKSKTVFAQFFDNDRGFTRASIPSATGSSLPPEGMKADPRE